ncbi:ABC transporter ATP-binding protein [Halovenus rubra]|uniref:ABC transporter ATP-binding protein n=2 Tax=Halovenus rubra TaxID=869890 RepID=A0ACC7E0H7_9EURY|nr:ABC transporter ATP-binding protein [Halovenus rubra]
MARITSTSQSETESQERLENVVTPTHSVNDAATTGETVLKINGLTRQYEQECAVEEVSLSVSAGELVTLLGPSGCGKTTTLRMIAGLEQPTEGSIQIEDTVVADDSRFIPSEDRDVGLVFQDFALFPHLSVEENITFGIKDWDRTKKAQRADELLELVGLSDHSDKSPDQLSGGQQQRVALARSLAPEPDVLLLDEPFSNLDVRLRIEMREEVRRILKEAGVTAISVTHDQEEALSISDRVAIMNDGHLEQVGKPEEVFENPESRFVASFLGRASFLPGTVLDDMIETEIGNFRTERLNGPLKDYDGADLDILVRPDDLEASSSEGATADGRIVHRQYNGPTFVYQVELHSGSTVRCLHNHAETFEHGQQVSVSLESDHGLAWYPRT